jgi:sugar phosphate isomerase/epimerase
MRGAHTRRINRQSPRGELTGTFSVLSAGDAHCMRILDAQTPQPKRHRVVPAGAQPVRALAPRPLQFSLAHLTLLELSPPQLTEIAARTGYDFVGLRVMPLNLPGEPVHALVTDAALRRRTRSALAATGLGILDVELARNLPALECAAELGAHHVLSSAWCTTDRHYVQDQFSRLCELARPLGLTVDFEFVTFAAYTTLHDAAELLRATRCSNAGIVVDTLHFTRSGHRPQELDQLPPEWFHYAQICDGPFDYSLEEAELKFVAREARWYVGEGGVGVADILAHLPRVPYSIELPNARRTAQLGHERYARQCLITARQGLQGRIPKQHDVS